jgi:hypothetical protein
MNSEALKKLLLIAATLVSVIAMWQHLPLADRDSYFNFADTRPLSSIPNAGDVLSNLPFMFVGLWGMWVTFKNRLILKEYKLAIFILSIGTFLTCFGSIYFHLNPNLNTLFWDRLPMTIGFMGLVILLILDRLSLQAGKMLIIPLLLLGMLTIVGWHTAHLSLRPYLVVQFGCLAFSLLAVVFTKSNHVKNSSILVGLGLYILAKVTEGYDLLIFQSTTLMSGHTLKHLLAAIAIFYIIYPFYQKMEKR